MSNTYNVNPGLKRCDAPTLLQRNFAERVSVDTLISGETGPQDGGGSDGGEHDEDEDTIYFKPKKIYRLEQESGSRQTLVRVYSETERSNFNEVTGKRMFDDWKYRPLYHHEEEARPRCDGVGSVSAGSVRWGDMQDEYVPDLDFAAAVKAWQAEELKEEMPMTRYQLWSEDESDFNLDSASSSMIIESSHAQVSPIPFPSSTGKSPVSAAHSLLTLNKALGTRAGSRVFSPSNLESKAKHRSMYDWGSLLSMSSAASIGDKFTQDDIRAITRKIPDDFLSLPYTQRKKILMDIAPDKDYKAIMSVFKKYSLVSSSSFTHLSNQGSRRSRHGSMASQYLSSFTPSSASFKPDERGSVVLGHRLGKIIGFGAWGMIRDCYDVKQSFVISPSESQPPASHAMKIVRFKNNQKVKEHALREISIWKKLHHPNILELINWKLEEDYAAYCLTEKIQDGTLYDLVSTWGESGVSTIPLDQRCKLTTSLALQLISALKYMHSKYIVHADVKLENCLLEKTGSESWKLYLCDFGMSCHYGKARGENEEPYSPDESMDFSTDEKKGLKNKRRPSLSKSSSQGVLKPLTKLQKIIRSKQQTHDDTPLGITSFPKQYGPSLTSTTMSSSSIWKQPSPVGSSSKLERNGRSGTSEEPDPATKAVEPHSHIGSLPYAAPELIDPCPPPLGPSADVWAAGVTMYTMLTGKLPFKHEYEPRLRAMISSGKYDTELLRSVCNVSEKNGPAPYGVGPAFGGLYAAVSGCLTKNMVHRWELSEVDNTLRNE
ncbi:AaceriAEL120Wp [[Ashbya] aceris (nom. inval.)]|nr:AaceriAEL120Wp [[Ashbya] aceris (nom. inval.)]